ncbi:cytochrome b/b6 domain-containing protein [Synechococcus sp. PCC 6312]|uniref:cytochrome b/b6 domain-containing protein n=1 Tax=Synechococcus sp. (strain ATCC 27167 / PCC 6312) TaxID=195253 RepID=UPI00029F3EA8|nr:cytochrome b/b6 domain-containing protein [Synechococcus sp. PCC 6312]AFY59339.1 Cytochrome b(N-terminal)/b6/petB [Synechococcus sp. PCC 6312]
MPYQPALLRILHGLITALVIFALVSGFWVYNTYDHRWGQLPLPNLEDIQGIHGTGALTFLIVLPLFAIYSFHWGYRRLVQPQSWQQLQKVGQPSSWVALQKILNSVMLLAATFAAITGRLMQEEWLPRGELNHWAYLGHLLAWLVMLVVLVLHIGLGVKVGGVPLVVAMFQLKVRASDHPKTWLQGWRLMSSKLLLVWEIIVISGIIAAFILPAFSA